MRYTFRRKKIIDVRHFARVNYQISRLFDMQCLPEESVDHFDFWHADNHLIKKETQIYFISLVWSDIPILYWQHLYNLKNVKSTHGGELILVKQKALAIGFLRISKAVAINPANIYLFKGSNRNIRKRCEICTKLTIISQCFYC